MTLTDEQTKQIRQAGALHYSDKRLAVLLQMPVEQVVKQLADTESAMAKAYNEGMIQAAYVIESKVFEKARAGEIAAIELYYQIISRED